MHKNRVKLNRGTISADPLKAQLRQYFWNLASYNCVDSKHKDRKCKCHCLFDAREWLDDEDIDGILDAVYEFALMERRQQKCIVAQWMRYAIAMKFRMYKAQRADRRKMFLIPGAPNRAELMICSYALIDLLGMTHYSWYPLWNKVQKGEPFEHGLAGKGSNRSMNSDFDILLTDFFETMKEFALPRATRLVRGLVADQVAVDVRDADEELLELPTSFSKRSLYNRFLNEIGWTFKYDSVGRVIEKVSEGDLAKPPSWATFLEFWKKYYNKLVIPNAAEDICNECYRYANRHKFVTTRQGEDYSGSDSNDGDEEDEEEEEEGEGDDGEAPDPAIEKMRRNEELILSASRHVTMAKTQRLLYQEKKRQAVETKDNRPSERILCYVGDYAQNLCLPNFASEQPGDTYYLSPLNCFCFGMVDCSAVPTRIAGLMYTEDIGRKGGNNVASLIWYNLQRLGVINTPEPFKEINIVMDNCGGQNKNRMVLRLLFYLVKRKVATVARIIFLVRGHTKNDCDRLFNLLKKDYRKCNVYTPIDLRTCISNPLIDPVIIEDQSVFRNFDKQQDGVIRRPVGINKHHCFMVSADRDNGNTLYMEPYDGSGEEVALNKIMKPKGRENRFWRSWRLPIPLKPMTILDIKWMELHDKWGKFIPEEKKSDWKYYSEDPGHERRDKVKDNRKRSKAARKERTATATTTKKPRKKPKGPPPGGATHPSSVI
jgi:hypothetical protein